MKKHVRITPRYLSARRICGEEVKKFYLNLSGQIQSDFLYLSDRRFIGAVNVEGRVRCKRGCKNAGNC